MALRMVATALRMVAAEAHKEATYLTVTQVKAIKAASIGTITTSSISNSNSSITTLVRVTSHSMDRSLKCQVLIASSSCISTLTQEDCLR